MTKSHLIWLFLLPALAWMGFGLPCALGGFTIADRYQVMIWLALGSVVFLAAAVGCIFKKRSKALGLWPISV